MSIRTHMIRLNGCQPRTLAGLMDLYERNYRRLRRLIPDLERLGDHSISRVNGMLDLHLSIMERHRFTTEILLTYRFPHIGGVVLEPNVQIRLYHDAGLAEAMGHARRRPMYVASCRRRYAQPTELELKWELNRFLNRWLGYCIRQGHLFLDYEAMPGFRKAEVEPG